MLLLSNSSCSFSLTFLSLQLNSFSLRKRHGRPSEENRSTKSRRQPSLKTRLPNTPKQFCVVSIAQSTSATKRVRTCVLSRDRNRKPTNQQKKVLETGEFYMFVFVFVEYFCFVHVCTSVCLVVFRRKCL